jgi:hypothetical protein
MHVENIKLSDFHKVFKDTGIGKRYLHVYPDGLIRIKLDEKKASYRYLYIKQHNSTSPEQMFYHVLSFSADRNRPPKIDSVGITNYTSFDPIFEIIINLAPDNIQTIILFNMERM